MYYHYDHDSCEFLFENHERVDKFPSTQIDINFNLPPYRTQIFKDEKWHIVYDYRRANIYKKNSVIKIFKKLGEKLEEDEIIYENRNYIPELKIEKTEENIKNDLKLEINGFLSKTDKYFLSHPPQYHGDIEKLKNYRNYLYAFTEKEKWWKEKLVSINEWK